MHRRLWSLALLGTALAAVVGCGELQDPIDRTEAYALPKTLFTGEWYYQQTVVQVPGTYTVSMVGNTNYNGMHRIRWDIQEKYLYARKSYELNPGAKHVSEDTGEYKGSIVGAWAISKQFDVKRGYNPRTGEENNVIEENANDCKWYDCKYIRVDWSKNLGLDYMFLSADELDGSIKKEAVPFYNQDTDPAWKPIFDETAGYIDVTTAMAIDPGTEYFPEYGKTYPLCWLFASQHADCSTQIIKLRNSFMRRDPNRDYEPRTHAYPEDEMWGFFRQERFHWERKYGLNYKSKSKIINRHNIWDKHHDAKTTCVAPEEGKADECVTKVGTGSKCDVLVPFHKYDVVTDKDGDGLPDSFEDNFKDAKGVTLLSAGTADSDGDGISDRFDDANGNGLEDIQDFWAWDRASLHYRCTLPMNTRVARPVAYFNTGFFPRDLLCDKDDTGTGPCKEYAFTASKATRDKNWSALHHIHQDYGDTWWKIFLRGGYGWSEADYQKWIKNPTDTTGFSDTQKKQLGYFGDTKNGYYAFTLCANNPVSDTAPWPCRFNHYTFGQAKELMDKGIKYTDLPYDVAKKLLDDGKKDEILKRGKVYSRHGDVRYSQINWVKDYYDGWALLGLGPSHTDPRTGENLAGVANVYALNDWAATRIQEQVQLLTGDMSPTDYVNGLNLENWVQSLKDTASGGKSLAPSVSPNKLTKIQQSMVQDWMKRVPRVGSQQLLNQYREKMSNKQLRNMLQEKAAKSGLFDPAKSRVSLSMIKGTQLEKRMIDKDVLLASGFKPSAVRNLNAEVLNRASPARGGFLKFLGAQEDWRFNLANKRNMYFLGMADDALVGLAHRLYEKYKDKSKEERAQAVWYEARDTIMRAVLTHEMGHTFGLHHNWGGSEDVMNFFPQYWKLRTNDGQDTKLCTNWKTAKAGDGQLCPTVIKGKEWSDYQLGTAAKNATQDVDSVYEYSYSSLMDYAGRYTIDGKGLGRYDKAAIMYGHADKIEVFKDTGPVPKGRIGDPSRNNFFEEWWSRDGSTLFFTGNGPRSFHYTKWYGWLGDKLINENNRDLVDYRNVKEFCHESEGKTAQVCDKLTAGNRRSIGYFLEKDGKPYQVRVPYLFCTYTRGNISDGCNTRDFGADQYEKMKNHIDNWNTWTVLRSFTRYQFPWDADKYVARNYRRTYKVLKNFNNSYALYQGLFRQWFPQWLIDEFFANPVDGWGTYTKAIHDAFNMALRTLAMPDIKNFELGTWPSGEKLYKEAEYSVDFRPDLSNARYFATNWSDTNYEDKSGLSFWEGLHHVGFYLDKMMALEVLSDPITYFVARDTAEDIREWRISFFDNYTTQIIDFFGSMLSEDFSKFAPYFDPKKPRNDATCTKDTDCGAKDAKCITVSGKKVCRCKGESCVVSDTNGNMWVNGIAWRNYATPALDVKAPTTGATVEASTRFTLQIYALVFGMMQFQMNFDNEFVARGRMWKEGSKNTISIKATKKISGLIKHSDPFSGQTYVGVAYVDKRGIAQRMLTHANMIKSRSQYCSSTPGAADYCKSVTAVDQAAADAALYDYAQLLDILVQLTAMYDNNGQNWSDDYEDP